MSKKKDDCMEEQPGWYNGQFLDEVGFCCDFICRHPMVCVGGKFFSKEGRIHDENGIKKQIYEMLRPYLKSGLAKKCSNLLEMLRMEAYKDTLPVHEDRLRSIWFILDWQTVTAEFLVFAELALDEQSAVGNVQPVLMDG